MTFYNNYRTLPQNKYMFKYKKKLYVKYVFTANNI